MFFKSTDPLQVLPYELWLECIRLYAQDQPEGPLPLLSISSTWQERLVESPTIWTTIYFDGGHDEECRTECFFHLSKTCPLTVVVGRNPGTMRGAINHVNRIKKILFWSRLTPFDSTFGTLFLSERLGDNWYSTLIHIDPIPPLQGETLLGSNLFSALPVLTNILYQRVFRQWKTIDSVEATENLAAVYYYHGKHEEAEKMGYEAMWRQKLMFGDEHISTILAQFNLAIIYAAQSKLEKVESLLLTISNLSTSYSFRERTEEIRLIEMELLERWRWALGRDHPSTIEAAESLVDTYLRQGHHEDARTLRQEARLQQRMQYFRDLQAQLQLPSQRDLQKLVSEWASAPWARIDRLDPKLAVVIGSTLVDASKDAHGYRCLLHNCEMCTERRKHPLEHIYNHLCYERYGCNGQCQDIDCDRRFTSPTSLRKHISGGVASCPHCSQRVYKPHLLEHWEQHCLEAPGYKGVTAA